MIEVKKVKKYYNRFKRNQVTAIDNTTLSLPDSGMVAILGNSGCGKTTLLNMMGGLDKPDSGKIFVNGKKMNGLFSGKTDNVRNKYIGYIFQNYHLIDSMTVFDNVALVLRMLGIRRKSQLKEAVEYALERVGLYRYRNRPASALSGGERQRVGIARAIVKNPAIIIADEPTGNLDSGNSLEVMNIIKAISKDKLVVLVTHERDLANFYADRIIEIVDGKVVSDRENIHDDTLDYRVENKLYLKDFEKNSELSADGVNVSFFSDGSSDANVTLVLRNGNLYIKCDGKKIEAVDADSAIELVDDHYRALTKEEAEKNDFDYSKLNPGKKKLRYHSIFNIFNLMWNGMKNVFSYPKLKKILLVGFVAAAMFVMYSISNIFGITTVTDDEFVNVNKNYLILNNSSNTVDSYYECKNLEGVKYVIPGDSRVTFTLSYSDMYYQANDAQDSLTGSISAVSVLSQESLIYGRMPQAENEIVIDKLTMTDILESGCGYMFGLTDYEKYVGRPASLSEMDDFIIVGICDCLSPCIYADDSRLEKIVMHSGSDSSYEYYDTYAVSNADVSSDASYSDENNTANVTPLENAKGELTIKKGRLPDNDYEVIVHYDQRYQYSLNKQITGKVNGIQLTVVGYYTSTEDDSSMFSNWNTYYYKYLASTSSITIYPEDKDAVISFYESRNQDIQDEYAVAKRDYEVSIKSTVKTTILIAGIVMLISLVEIFLMLRSSFLSRVKEVGILRAIGLKKSDVYKMFLGEILAITTVTAPIAFVVMGKVLTTLTKVDYFAQQYVFDAKVLAVSAIIIYGFNIVVGLIPVMTTLTKTPAAILARTDVD